MERKKRVNPDQQIRAEAARAAATLVPRGSALVDFLSACDVITSFIGDGWEAAIATYEKYGTASSSVGTPEPHPTGPQSVTLVEPMAAPVVSPAIPAARTEAEWDASPESAAAPEPERDYSEIPTEINKPVSPQQSKAMHIVDKTRKERVKSILGQAGIAKIRAHMDRLVESAQEANLWDFKVQSANGEVSTVKAELKAMYEKRYGPGSWGFD